MDRGIPGRDKTAGTPAGFLLFGENCAIYEIGRNGFRGFSKEVAVWTSWRTCLIQDMVVILP
jgi:hypothetical protein